MQSLGKLVGSSRMVDLHSAGTSRLSVIYVLSS